MKRTFATLAIAAATVTAGFAPASAGLLGAHDRAQVQRVAPDADLGSLSVSQQAAIHGILASEGMNGAVQNGARINAIVNQ